MQLLSPSDLTEIGGAFRDLSDTFLQTIVIYHRMDRTTDRFMEGSSQAENNYALKGMVVHAKTGLASQIDILRIGKQDMTESYVLFYYPDIETAGLVDTDGKLLMRPDRDFLSIGSEKYEVIGVNPAPDLVTLKTFVKVQFRKNLKNANG